MLRDGNVVLARTELDRSERVVIAGHLDTVPVAGNLPSWTTQDGDGREIIWGRGACDMKGGVAVQLSVAAALATAAARHHLGVLRQRGGRGVSQRSGPDRRGSIPSYLQGSFAVLCEPTNARIEGGCQGTMQLQVELTRSSRTFRAVLDGAQRHSRCRRLYCNAWPRTSHSRSRSTG